jgi:hypothetical protein
MLVARTTNPHATMPADAQKAGKKRPAECAAGEKILAYTDRRARI